MPNAYAYCRVSTNKQAISIDVQKADTLKYWESRLKEDGIAFGGHFVDFAESAYKKPFLNREAGLALQTELRQGDHILITRLDRAFRTLKDTVTMLAKWSEDGMIVHVLNIGLSTNTSIGRYVIHVMGATAELEREMISERTREALSQRKAKGLTKRKLPGYGVKWCHSPGDHNSLLMQLFPLELDAMEVMYAWRLKGFSNHQIASHLWQNGVYYKTRNTRFLDQQKVEWSPDRVHRGIKQWKEILANPNDPRHPNHRESLVTKDSQGTERLVRFYLKPDGGFTIYSSLSDPNRSSSGQFCKQTTETTTSGSKKDLSTSPMSFSPTEQTPGHQTEDVGILLPETALTTP